MAPRLIGIENKPRLSFKLTTWLPAQRNRTSDSETMCLTIVEQHGSPT